MRYLISVTEFLNTCKHLTAIFYRNMFLNFFVFARLLHLIGETFYVHISKLIIESFFFILTNLSRDCCSSVTYNVFTMHLCTVHNQSFMISLACRCWIFYTLLSVMVVLVLCCYEVAAAGQMCTRLGGEKRVYPAE